MPMVPAGHKTLVHYPDGTSKVTYTRVPKLDEVPYPVQMEPNLVIEFYSR